MSPVALTSTTINEFMPDLVPTGVDEIHPDYSSLRLCLYAPGHASVMCFVSEGFDNVGFERCPRSLLRSALATAERNGLEIKFGFEVEFKCFNLDGTELEECIEAFSSATGLRNRYFKIIEEAVQQLVQSGIEVLQFHTEESRGLFEISTGPMPVFEAIDSLIYTRETLKTLFTTNNIIATFHPSPTPKHCGTAAQFHLSISPVTPSTADHFLAGILDRLSALCAFSLPLAESYKRVNDFDSEAGAYVAWGTQNRDVPIRKICDGRWEVRCCDGAANMYLVAAAFIASGVAGVEEKTQLRWKDYYGCPGSANEQERAKFGIQSRLPADLHQSLEALKGCDWNEIGLGPAATAYAKIKTHELTSLGRLSNDARRALLIRHF
jgi:glutamine synthetase